MIELAEVRTQLENMSAESRAEVVGHARRATSGMRWIPNPGPQVAAYHSKADLLLFGGALGGGKSDLILGLALNEHKKTVVYRRQADDLRGFWDRLNELVPTAKESNSNLKRLVTHDGRLIECGHLDAPGSELSWQGRPHDLIAFDEGAQLSAEKVNFVMGWNRSTDPKQRCRIVIATNPPIGGEGQWLVEWFAPWLDPLSAHYGAADGELRWCVVLGQGREIITRWVDGPDPVEIDGEKHIPTSRTFIKSLLDDNPFLRDTGYRARVNAFPEPLRSQLLYGDFQASRQDADNQVIPTWAIQAAQARWREGVNGRRQIALAADIAQGGGDKTTLASLYDGGWFDRVKSYPGIETPDGPTAAAKILMTRRDGSIVGIDTTGGWGGSARDHLRTHNCLETVSLVASSGSAFRDKETGLGYLNLRAQMWWEFRKELCDPASSVALPPDQKLTAELGAPTYSVRGTNIVVESKDDLRKRLGSSTDHADAVLMAWHIRARQPAFSRYSGPSGRPKVNLGYANMKQKFSISHRMN